jgi:hypothetical protein
MIARAARRSPQLCARPVLRSRIPWTRVLLLLAALAACAAPSAAHARDLADPYALAIDDAHLGMTAEEFRQISTLQVQPAKDPHGKTLAWRAKTKSGFPGGGMFQVMFTRKELGRQAYNITLNRRWHVANEDLDPIYARFEAAWGPADTFCIRQYEKHYVYHAYWGVKLPDCTRAGEEPDTPHLYLNLVSGKWTELFATLTDPALLRQNIRAAAQASEEGEGEGE